MAADATTLLFDEPFAAADPTIRSTLRVELRERLAELAVASVFVTHDQAEARACADEVAILRDGAIVQCGQVTDVFAKPANAFAAAFLGVENRWSGIVTAVRDGVATVRLDAGSTIAGPCGSQLREGAPVLVCVRAEDVAVTAAADPAARNAYEVCGARRREEGAFVLAELDAAMPILCRLSRGAWAMTQSTAVKATIAADGVHLIPQGAA